MAATDEGDYKLIEEERLSRADSFLTVVRRKFQYRLQNGELSPVQARDIMARPDAAAMLLYDEACESVVLVRQFRVATVQGETPGRDRTRRLKRPTKIALPVTFRAFLYRSGPG